jgi:predicted nucleic-acid-binding protein
MKIIADTDVLLRVIVGDEPKQARMARNALQSAELVAITSSTFCELGWVLSSVYDYSRSEIAEVFRDFISAENVLMDRASAEAGLSVLDAGGDFADGVIAFEGRRLGGETFVSFDRQAVRLLKAGGVEARLLQVS